MSLTTQRMEDTIVAALLAGFWAGIGIDKVDALAMRFNLTAIHVVVQWWPLLLIAAGVALLFRHQKQSQMIASAQPAIVVEMPMQRKEAVHAR